MSKETEVDMKDVELNEMDPEKQPMNTAAGNTETNGCVKVKVPDEQEVKFTGLTKEELLKVAGTPGWVRVRWALLILFWLGWLGMLAGAIVIIVQAPRCKTPPSQEWWQQGVLYQINSLKKFPNSDGDRIGSLMEIQKHLDALTSLKVKALVVGPIHQVEPGSETRLEEINPDLGKEDDFKNLMKEAKNKGIRVVLDLTPNYNETNEWFDINSADSNTTISKLQIAMNYWLKQGVDGIWLGGIEELIAKKPEVVEEWKNITSKFSMEDKSRVLIGAIEAQDQQHILNLLNTTSTDLLVNSYLHLQNQTGTEVADLVMRYLQSAGDKWISWGSGSRKGGHMRDLSEKLQRLYQVLLLTLPGTPITNYGDEIKLLQAPKESESILKLYRKLSELKVKERSLLYGEFYSIYNCTQIFSYLREWDQSERFLVVLNLAGTKADVSLQHSHLPEEAMVVLSSDTDRKEGKVKLKELTLSPLEGLLLKFPYVA
ncbi:amino acid transporter heavy chain SLC3A2 [Latimeria chalumnae]|uniref:amino acid transporter heavy chain SLC3A2 n=1 Tax=Latimeria chalumnae TaxID=7897 RepID=UPI0006D9194C|nr:PREDICTED: 4F2 cell-surface antigen heavy chain [Latimeria chalumnae]|eukprot:XP_014354332.1 PREDICTED: 4F2 cell-surface antigen heavy chain [Latimeria chalumnae]